ncbi:hypothetical protein HG536_0E01000 [Torulaspora globosa]|uniref:NADP-dependent oxidoreductase domain-containing protein n=1 Tax=Torulaspora globosa TaxID=48254 RepID=A0A7G3ZI53_9SACH|nr:uncharacterized protein HG536_0E01000 [Torulaspora globosa]QLL33189.1 hypothetical protein HG536_0E01000 [Torulaspora globosa]
MSTAVSKNTSTIKLNTGYTIPQVGLGTWRSKENEGYKAVLTALQAGYRHIDDAAIYLNEEEVGRAIKDSGVPREEIFLTTKLWNTQQRTPEEALNQSLKRLGVDYVDLYLMHWPVPFRTETIKDGNYLTIPKKADGRPDVDEEWNFVKTWELMQELPKTGKVRSVGVSNFSINNLKELLSSPGNKLTPAVNQIELHPLLPEFALVDFCKEHGIVVEAYSPFGGQDAPVLDDNIINQIAKDHGADAGQVIVSWGVQRGIVTLPKSVTPARVVSNLQTFKLSDDEFRSISQLTNSKKPKRTNAPDMSPFPLFE